MIFIVWIYQLRKLNLINIFDRLEALPCLFKLLYHWYSSVTRHLPYIRKVERMQNMLHKSTLQRKFFDLIWKSSVHHLISLYFTAGTKWQLYFLAQRYGSFIFHILCRYFPKGGGFCRIDIRPVKFLQPIQLTDFGDISQIFGWSYVAGNLPIHVS